MRLAVTVVNAPNHYVAIENLRYALIWDVTQCRFVVSYQCLGCYVV